MIRSGSAGLEGAFWTWDIDVTVTGGVDEVGGGGGWNVTGGCEGTLAGELKRHRTR